MALATVHQQALAAIAKSNHTLICFPEAVSGDGVGSALGLGMALEGLRPGHQVDVACSGFTDTHRQQYQFLPNVDRVRPTLASIHELTIRVNLKTATVDALRYDVKDDHLNIHLTPASGELTKEHIESAMSSFKYDLVIVLDCADLSSLGALYTNHAQFFQSTPIIAIDHAPEHERYGQINLVDLAAVACGEVCAAFLRDVSPACLNADVATCLLTGILAETRGFRHPRMTPKTFDVTAALLTGGARREDVVQHLFQTKTIGQLKLWGRALSRLRHDPDRGIIWTLLSQGDFLAAGAVESDLLDIVDELLVNAPAAHCILLCYEQKDGTTCVIARTPNGRYDAARLLAPLGGSGTPLLARACLATKDLVAAERTVLEAVRKSAV
ncbi:hypothetical protein HY480_02880 [Candidatus Uhrbacteria bacterium]|nr:hypothetical protein [Candidatus Uhrbacteria bacterium]